MTLSKIFAAAAILFICASSSRSQDAVSLAQQELERRNFLAAVRILESLLPRQGDNPSVRKLLGQAYLGLGEREIALDNLALAAASGDKTEDSKTRIRALLEAGFPSRLSKESPQGLGINLRELVVRAQRLSRQDSEPLAVKAFLTTQPLPPDEERRRDPLFGRRFQQAIYGAVMSRGSDSWLLAFRAIIQKEQRLPLAAQCLDLLLRLRALWQLNVPTRRLGPVDIWLCEDGKPGAQSSGSNIYVLSAGAHRTPEEWVRQLCHEFGHIALPGVDHFPEPEPWCNGPMGELVFGRWLAEAMELSAPPHEWLGPQWSQAFHEQRFWPAIEAILESGLPTRKDGVKAYAALGAYAEAAFGPQILLDALPRASPEREALIAGLQRAIASRSQTGLTINLTSLPPRARSGLVPLLVYLPEGGWTATAGPPPARLSLDGRLLECSGENFTLGRVKAGWHSITIGGAPEWEQLVLTRVPTSPRRRAK
jgi:hypothetical protein